MALSSISITAPSSAREGDRVLVSARVKNISAAPYNFRVKLYAVRDIYAVPGPGDLLGTFEATIGSGGEHPISAFFTMPSWDAIILVMVHVFINYWDFDDYATKVVSFVAEAEPPTPTDEELLYANWLRTGGTGSIEYWRSIGSPLYYTPPEPEPEQTYHLNVHVPSWAAGGYINPGSGDYTANSTVKLTAHPISGYQFTGWGGDASGTSPTFNLYMNSDKYVEAYFEKVPVEPVEEFAGSISKKELEYDESQAPIPVYNIPEGERGLVHIWGRNNMATSQKLGIYWFIADPDGMIVEEYEDWEWGTTGPGDEHHFIGGRFDLDREKYTMWVELLMNPDNPEIVARYIGDLCTVAAVVTEYKGSILKKELEYDETRGNIPVY